ncbi:hypothetical protein Syun_002248 [Stephania yunnanensis]|uniref:Lipoxygenase domain-containing protein n=1 Tax=Stephania yunnanensis TaxID=152371 RepID=A0AAP0Q7V2_9MAGN
MGFPFFTAIDSLYNQGDRFSWLTDKEFARETLAGINPYSIQLVKEWPLTSKLEPKLYGPPESAITKELVEKEIGEVMTVEEDPNAEHGLKLAIQDYPFANDGLILWDAIREWVSDYVNHYYPHTSTIEDDKELQAWWTKVRTVGHGDKKDEPWWPVLNTHENLIQTLSTIIWVNSSHHAAVNFSQYGYAGYFPNRPSVARTKMPDEDPNDDEYTEFLTKPESAMLQCLPSQRLATTVMTILDVLSTHSTDEEYIADKMEPSWEEAPAIKGAFERFRGKVMELTGIIDGRNLDEGLLNRNGAGVVP